MKRDRNQISINNAAGVIVAVVLVLGMISIPISAKAAADPVVSGACNCVIFRIDDIQDYWLNKVQTALMDHFIAKNEKLGVGIIMNSVGNDSSIVGKVREGFASGKFKLLSHGWNHVDYTTLTPQQQHDTLEKANQKMASLWKTVPAVFIPSYNAYNNDTLSSLESLKMKIISTAFEPEFVSIYNPKEPNSPDNRVYKAMAGSHVKDGYGIYHLPEAAGYYTYSGDTHSKTPIKSVLSGIDSKISSYGYAVVTLHPQDFAVKDTNKKPVNKVDPDEMSGLDTIINYIHKQGYTIKNYSEVVGGDTLSTNKT